MENLNLKLRFLLEMITCSYFNLSVHSERKDMLDYDLSVLPGGATEPLAAAAAAAAACC